MSDVQFPDEQETLRTIRGRMFVALREGWRPGSADRAAAELPRMAAQFSLDEDEQFADPDCRSFYATLNEHPGLEEDFLLAVAASLVPEAVLPDDLTQDLLGRLGRARQARARGTATPRAASAAAERIPVVAALAEYLRHAREGALRTVEDVRAAFKGGQFEGLLTQTLAAQQQLGRSAAMRGSAGESPVRLLRFEAAVESADVELQVTIQPHAGDRWQVECSVIERIPPDEGWGASIAEQAWSVEARLGTVPLTVQIGVTNTYRLEPQLSADELTTLVLDVAPA